MEKNRYLSTADASRVLGVTPATIRLMARRGDLPVAAMTEGGIHLFRRATVEGRPGDEPSASNRLSARAAGGTAMARNRRAARTETRKSRKDPLARERGFEVLQLMRSKGYSLTRAAREAHTTRETTRKHVGQALTRSKSGRYAATASDRLTRRVWFLTKTGKVEVSVRGSRVASRVAQHSAAVHHFLTTGDSGPLDAFQGQAIRSRNQIYFFLTDSEALEQLANAGQVSFERLYVLRA